MGRLSLSCPVARAEPICAISRAASTAPLPCPPHGGQAGSGNAADTQADKKVPGAVRSEHASAMKPKRR